MTKLSEIEQEYIRAVESEKQGDYTRAVDLYSGMTEKFPGDSRGWTGLANIYFSRIGDAGRSEEFFTRAIDTGNAGPETYFLYSDLLMRQGRFPEMNAVVNQAMQITGVRKSTGYYKTGLLKESQGNYADAMEFYKKAILESFSSDEIGQAEQSIDRCRVKMKYS
jgi:tetratricopeptide (TPR) repeat protein